MAYTTPAAVRLALSPDGDTSANLGTAAALDDTALNDAIAEVQAEVDARLSGRFTVPFQDGSVPAVVAQIVRDLAAYKATLTYRRNVPVPDNDPVALRNAQAFALLIALQNGQAGIVGASGEQGSTPEAVAYNIIDGDLFSLQDFSLAPARGRPSDFLLPTIPYDDSLLP